ncbi:hypothetical protein FG05_30632 [Fusarium graminearum]|nr:hypothetical protein FG05_30632 [Fusarium graminearum]
MANGEGGSVEIGSKITFEDNPEKRTAPQRFSHAGEAQHPRNGGSTVKRESLDIVGRAYPNSIGTRVARTASKELGPRIFANIKLATAGAFEAPEILEGCGMVEMHNVSRQGQT